MNAQPERPPGPDPAAAPPRLHVLLTREQIDREALGDKVVIVLDILFATTSIVAALQAGAAAVVPLAEGGAAHEAAAQQPADSCVMAGELNARTLPGFLQATPLALCASLIQGRTVLYATTNGTPALLGASGAHRVYAGALTNAEAVVAHVMRAHAGRTVVIVCAGSTGRVNLEDVFGAGYFVSLFQRLGGTWECSDAALVAALMHGGADVEPGAGHPLWLARVGRLMQARGLEAELQHAACKSCFDVVPVLDGTRMVPAG